MKISVRPVQLAIIIFMLPLASSSPAPAQHLERANAQGAIGETDSLYLTPPGLFIHPYYNDVSGGTDKLLTASAKIGSLWQYSDSSYELIARWRFLTPAYQHAFAETPDDNPPGRYADWAELSQTYARTVAAAGERLKLQGTLGVNHVGNKGAKQVHYWIHKNTRNQVKYLEYTNQPKGSFLNGGIQALYLAAPSEIGGVRVNLAPGIGADGSKFMTETYATVVGVACMRCRVWELAGEVRAIFQHESSVYESVRPFRYEVAFGTLFFNRYKPTIKYVSAYLNGDRIGQTYFDFLNVQIPF